MPQLLAHRSGIKDPANADDWKKLIQSVRPLNNIMQVRPCVSEIFLTKKRTNTQKLNYSNISYVIAGAILEKVTKKTWEKLMSENIFIPLEMTSAGFGSPANENLQNPDQPWGHKKEKVAEQINIIPTYDDNPELLGPAVSIHCSIKDWLKYIKINIDGANGRNTKILPADAFKILRQTRSWVTGLMDRTNVIQACGRSGDNTAFLVIVPKLESAIVFVTNCQSYDNQNALIADVIELNMDRIHSKLSRLNIEQEKILWSWNKKELDKERFRMFTEKDNSRSDAKKNGYGPGAMVIYKDRTK